jgi:predicted RNA binding protein YcfA (HicA-like mRNA interferase family)
MRNQPNGIKFDEVRKVLENNGYEVDNVNGSHYIFRSGSGDHLSIPKKTPVKGIYVRQILALVGGDD